MQKAGSWHSTQSKVGRLYPLLNIGHRDDLTNPLLHQARIAHLNARFPFGLTLIEADDNTPLRKIQHATLAAPRRITDLLALDSHLNKNNRYLLFTGNYTNLLTHHTAFKKYLDTSFFPRLLSIRPQNLSTPTNRNNRREFYLQEQQVSYLRSRLLNRLTVGVDKQGISLLGVRGGPKMTEENPLQRILRAALAEQTPQNTESSQGAMIGFSDYLTFKGSSSSEPVSANSSSHSSSRSGAWQYEMKGIEVPQLGRGTHLKVRYGVFPPTRSDYIELLTRMLQRRESAKLEVFLEALFAPFVKQPLGQLTGHRSLLCGTEETAYTRFGDRYWERRAQLLVAEIPTERSESDRHRYIRRSYPMCT